MLTIVQKDVRTRYICSYFKKRLDEMPCNNFSSKMFESSRLIDKIGIFTPHIKHKLLMSAKFCVKCSLK
ncbi:hypothetical protein BpHYR1_011627 [Brachionus plicatilis]|uniref:Uncharacterized protein n=1 Tax=Brachionus plicatilis TaxID=10195 RepID=A0A3M7SRV0_BRAPC|nr:hypothetical protein BpHYR1_011627 [Brachionus plicatilis]